MTIRVVLAEDHETVRQGLRLLIEAQSDMVVVGEASDGQLAVERARTLQPTVMVVDLSMPEVNGLAATRLLKQTCPTVAVVALTRHADEAYVRELLAAGALGYVLKQSPSSELLTAIRAAAAGREHVDSALPQRTAPGYARSRSPNHPRPLISEREAEVLRLIAVGHSNKEIAENLAISVKTVEVHKANAMRKLRLQGRIDIIKFALLQGWLTDP